MSGWFGEEETLVASESQYGVNSNESLVCRRRGSRDESLPVAELLQAFALSIGTLSLYARNLANKPIRPVLQTYRPPPTLFFFFALWPITL